jgi:hypothetical protein
MRKFLTSAIAAVTAAGAVAAVAAPAEARDYYRRGGGYHYRHHGGSNDAAVAAVAGIAGLAIGAAIAGNGSTRGGRGYSSNTYVYNNGYAYDPRYDSYAGDYYDRPVYRDRVCISRERVWDPYIGRHVRIERRYPC